MVALVQVGVLMWEMVEVMVEMVVLVIGPVVGVLVDIAVLVELVLMETAVLMVWELMAPAGAAVEAVAGIEAAVVV